MLLIRCQNNNIVMGKENQRLAAIGENMVIIRLLQLGVDAINANNIHTNFARVDILCPNDSGFTTVQVKTSDEKSPNFPTGLSISQAEDRSMIEKAVIGPWVFVHTHGEGSQMTFDFYILSRKQMIDLIYESNRWYVNGYNRVAEIKKTSPVGVKLSWIKGEGEDGNAKRIAFTSPIPLKDAQDAWHKILKP